MEEPKLLSTARATPYCTIPRRTNVSSVSSGKGLFAITRHWHYHVHQTRITASSALFGIILISFISLTCRSCYEKYVMPGCSYIDLNQRVFVLAPGELCLMKVHTERCGPIDPRRSLSSQLLLAAHNWEVTSVIFVCRYPRTSTVALAKSMTMKIGSYFRLHSRRQINPPVRLRIDWINEIELWSMKVRLCSSKEEMVKGWDK